MTWLEFKAEVDKQIEEKGIDAETCLLYIDLYPGEGVSVGLTSEGTLSIS